MSDSRKPEMPVDSGVAQHHEEMPQEGVMNAATAAGLEQMREILFGQQSRTVEQRLARVEEGLERSVNQLADDTTQRIDAMEAYLKNELTMLIDKLGTQREERSAAFQQVRTEFEATAKKFEKKLAELSDRIAQAQSETRSEWLRQLNAITEDLETRSEAMSHDLAAESAQLRNDLVDRASMGSILTEVAMRLNGPPMPGPEHADAAEEMLGELLGGAAHAEPAGSQS